MSRYQHPSYARYLGRVPAQLLQESIPDPGLTALAGADRACCCPARPEVIVVMPTAPGERQHHDLLLCMHHYRISRQKLAACGARVLDRTGAALTDSEL